MVAWGCERKPAIDITSSQSIDPVKLNAHLTSKPNASSVGTNSHAPWHVLCVSNFGVHDRRMGFNRHFVVLSTVGGKGIVWIRRSIVLIL